MPPQIDNSHPVHHTGVIESTRDALEKLWWNFQVFGQQLSARDHGTGQGYAIIDFAVTSGSLHAWFCAEYKIGVAAGRLEPKLGPPEGISAVLQQRVRFWAELQAIANASKHRNLSPKYWLGGVNLPLLQSDDTVIAPSEYEGAGKLAKLVMGLADGALWYENVFYTPGSGQPILASKALPLCYDDWHSLVHEVGPDF